MGTVGILSAAWVAYFALHSWWASEGFKAAVQRRWPQQFPHYRLAYNVLALLLLLPIVWLTFATPSPILWRWEGAAAWGMNALALAALGGFFHTLRYYDSLSFLGLRRGHETHIGRADEPFVISPWHRYVRHPWYALGLVLIWTRDMPLNWFVACVALTLYLLVGSRLEEHKLLRYYGERYQRYRARVPALIPWPGRSLRADEAHTLQKD
ncbi:MAG: methyltransferase family protein [Thiotrichales bacterium]